MRLHTTQFDTMGKPSKVDFAAIPDTTACIEVVSALRFSRVMRHSAKTLYKVNKSSEQKGDYFHD